jgi:hypothetical protein
VNPSPTNKALPFFCLGSSDLMGEVMLLSQAYPVFAYLLDWKSFADDLADALAGDPVLIPDSLKCHAGHVGANHPFIALSQRVAHAVNSARMAS